MRALVALVILLELVACNGDGDWPMGGQTSGSDDMPFVTGSEAPFTQRVNHDETLFPCVLPLGTMGLPDPLGLGFLPDLGGDLLEAVSKTAPESVPEQISLRTDTATYNRLYQFVLHEGSVWYKPNTEVTGVQSEWTQVPMPGCLAGTLIGISADDDELIAIRRNGDIYGLDNILKDPLLFNWTSRWGTPVWLGTGYHIPEEYRAWSWTVISNAEDKNWTDPAGNQHRVGDGKVSHIWLLGEDGQRFTFLDPWLAHDESYEMCGPLRGRFKAVNLSSSGSNIMTINRYGDIYTRHYDFDLAGDNEVFFQYSFDDQRGVSNPKIQLPVYDWVKQPKVPGAITHNISIHKVGENMIHRIMRIEGRDAAGRSGYWEKDITLQDSADWEFVRTDMPLRGTLLDNSLSDTSQWDSGDNEDAPYSRNMAMKNQLDSTTPIEGDDDWAAELANFNLYCSPTVFRVHTAANESMDLVMHVVDVIRQTPRARGMDENPRGFRGAIELPDALLSNLDSLSPRQTDFIDLYLGGNKFTEVRMSGVLDAINISGPGIEWTFSRP